ncbi:MAG: hypothetical protein AAGH15_11245, partial [Myxococcota bacterium]
MLNVDEFESVFRAAAKQRFRFAPPRVETLLVVTDLEGEDLATYLEATRRLLEPLTTGREPAWTVRAASEWEGVEGVLGLVDDAAPDLIVTYRNLRSDAWKYSYSLGVYLNALTRATPIPVFVTPHPVAFPALGWKDSRTDSVMVINDALTGDDALVNWGCALTRAGGTLHLTHVEHDEIFARYIEAIGKIPEIDTETARTRILEQLLREPTEYIESAKTALEEAGLDLELSRHVFRGNRGSYYRRFAELL